MVVRKNEYFPNLDSLRFVSFLLVFISHCFSFLGYQPSNHLVSKCIYYLTLNGDLGVHFFFVLSGFLITIKLLDEKNESGSIDLFEFYKKRISILVKYAMVRQEACSWSVVIYSERH